MTTYAAGTDVPVERSRMELERTLGRYGAEQFAYVSTPGRAVIQFIAAHRQVRFVIDLPRRDDPEFTHTPARKTQRSATQAEAAWEKACRERWRAINLVVKAKLQAVESGISEFEDEFMAHIVLPDGDTVGDWLRPQIHAAYSDGVMPNQLALGSGS